MGLLNKPEQGLRQEAAAGRRAGREGVDTVSDLMWRIFNRSLLALGIMTVLALVIGQLLKGLPGLVSALVSLGLLILFCLTTPVILAVLSRRKVTFTLLAASVMGAWIIKVIIVVAALLSLRSAGWFDHSLFAVFVLVEVVVVIGIEVQAVLSSRLPYVDPPSSL